MRDPREYVREYDCPGESNYQPTSTRPKLPNEVRLEVTRRSGGWCEDCGDSRATSIHHCTYRYMWPTEDKTPADELRHLCRSCHRGRHVDAWGDWHNDPEDIQE